MKKTIVYIDGFNLYYGAVKGTPYKWLDLKSLMKRIFPNNDIIGIKYFTAMVQPFPDDPDKTNRQEIYLRALKQYIPEIEIFKGYFLRKPATMPLAPPESGFVRVIKTEEKGSDVNLAVHLLHDAWRNLYEAAIVVSNDSDLAESIRLVVTDLKKPVGVLNPRVSVKNRMSVQLHQVASFRGRISVTDLSHCQLPDSIPGTNLQRPVEWKPGFSRDDLPGSSLSS